MVRGATTRPLPNVSIKQWNAQTKNTTTSAFGVQKTLFNKKMKKPFIIAHRIVNETINNQEALKKLLTGLQNKNVSGVEFDIRQTKDNEFIAFHDAKFSQLKGDIKNYTLKELKKETSRKRFSFLTMEETIKEIPENFEIQIDIKDKMINIKKFLEIINQYGIQHRLIISSFYPTVIFKFSSSKIKKRWLLTSFTLERNLLHIIYALSPVITAFFCKATGIGPKLSLINKNIVKKSKSNNLTIATWTINNEKEIKNLLIYDIDYLIISPDLILKNDIVNYLKLAY